PDLSSLAPDNVAAVMVTATLPPFVKRGTKIDVSIQSMGDAKSLEGGQLLAVPLHYPLDPTRTTYAIAYGAITVGGFRAEGGGTSITKNHVLVASIPGGATVEKEVPVTFTDGQSIDLLLERPDFITATRMASVLNQEIGRASATAYSAGHVNVKIPTQFATRLPEFIASVMGVEVEPAQARAKVVINERTGTVVVNGGVKISPVAIAQGSITISVFTEKKVIQSLPFSAGQTAEQVNTQAMVLDKPGMLFEVSGVEVSEIVDGLNKLGVTTRDLIQIFQALHKAGALQADLEVI
ncbi:flagellar basal body P-ring protein FlgI, partial [Candidatus Hydrogenedentota bacterium]